MPKSIDHGTLILDNSLSHYYVKEYQERVKRTYENQPTRHNSDGTIWLGKHFIPCDHNSGCDQSNKQG